MKLMMGALILALSQLTATAQDYNFNIQHDTYQNLDSLFSANLTDGLVWEDEQFVISVGFDFPIQNSFYDTVKIEDDGFFVFFQQCGLDTDAEGPILLALFCDLADRGVFLGNGNIPLSSISYLVENISGTKILKVEWKNATLSFGEGYDDFINFQVWLYESGTIEIRFGESNITDPSDPDAWGWGESGPLVNLIYEIDCALNNPPVSLHVFGNANAPGDTIIQGSIQGLPVVPINNVPLPGTVYQFLPIQDVSVENSNDIFSSINIFPNPAKSSATLKLPENGTLHKGDFIIYDLSGKLVYEIKNATADNSLTLDLHGLQSGFYLCQYKTPGKSFFHKLVVE